MMCELPDRRGTIEVSFADAPFEIIDGDRGKHYPKQDELLPEGDCLFLSANNVTKQGFSFANNVYISAEKDGQLRKGKLKRGDIVLTTRGTLGNVGYYSSKIPYDDLRINSGMVIIRANAERILPSYLYCFLRSQKFQDQVNGLRSGVAQPQIPIRDLKAVKIAIPPLPTQKRIADILSAYDDLIENNRRRMEILEESARLIYRKMFGSKRKSTKLLHLEDFVERTISGDWGKESLDRKCTEKIMCLRGADIPSLRYRDFGKGIVRFVTPQHVEERAMKDGDLFVEMSGGSPTQATGRVGLVSSHLLRDAELPVLCTNFCRVVRPKSGYAFFLYLAWLDLYDQDLMFMFEHSAIALKNFDLDLFLKKILVVKPEDSQLRDFNEKLAGVMEQMDVLGGENRRLIKARDMLLPKLMNGELEGEKVKMKL